MNLVVIAALIAACGAAKLDRTYLPPASAKTAGGSPGSLQAPFAGNSLNNGLGGLPKGSFENDFEGVVVDAAAPGTRTSEPGSSGLGAPRISYGSTNSKVGAAAFKTRPSAFAQPAQSEEQFQDAQDSLQNGAMFQQGFSGSNFGPQQAERQRASVDRSASILRYENENDGDNYHYAFETDNGISAEENGVATNGVQAQGGFSYTGDDGQVYSISYTADEKGYLPKGDHLPTPPPIPVEILKSLEQNARDEAAGLVDDGSYDAERYNAGSDYAESGDANGKYTHQSSKFGGSEADASTFNQDQASRRPVAGQSSFNGQLVQGSRLNGQSPNKQGFAASSNRFSEQTSESFDDDSTSGQFGQASSAGSQGQTNELGSFAGSSTQTGSKRGQSRPGLGNRNEYLPPVNRPDSRPQGKPQNGRPQANRPQTFVAASDSHFNQAPGIEEEGSENAVPLGQQDLQEVSRPQQGLTSFGKPISNGISSQTGFGSSNNQNRLSNGRRPSSNGNNFAQGQSSQSGRPNEYLPPRPSNQNRRPSNQPQKTSNNNFGTQFSQQNDDNADGSDGSQSFSGSGLTGSQSSFGTQSQQSTGFSRPQSLRPGQNGNRFPSQSQTSLNTASAQSTFGLKPQKATVQPATELTTPIESANADFSMSVDSETNSADTALSPQLAGGRPTQSSFSSQYNQGQNSFGSQPVVRPQASRPQRPRPFGQTQASAFPTQSSVEQFNQNSQLVSQPLTQNSFGQNDDAQYSSSTQRPSYTGQPQGPDDSYYYNQPSRPFGTPQASRFPSTSSNQFDRVIQQSSFSQNQFPNVPSTAFPSGQFQGSTKQPRPPTLATTSSTAQIQGQFGNNYRQPGSTRQPRPPTLAPIAPTAAIQSQYQGNTVNGVTQASISPFPSQKPTQASQSQFGSRPSYQQTQFSQSTSPSFAKQPTQPSLSQQSTSGSFPKRPSSVSSFNQQTESQDEPSNDENEQPVPSQQYTGEIYEYNKPAVTLPPPDSTPVAPSGQFGQKMPVKGQFTHTQAQFGQTSDKKDQSPASQFEGQIPATQGFRPQSGGQSKPQFGQNSFGTQAQDKDTKPFGALAQSQAMFGTQTSQQSRPQFGQSRPQFSQTQNTFDQSQSTQGSDDGSQPQSGSELNPDVDDEAQSSGGPKNQFGFVSACCKTNASRKPGQTQFGVQAQDTLSSFAGAQKQPTNSFVGAGEQFDGSRQPPSFDEETGYHY